MGTSYYPFGSGPADGCMTMNGGSPVDTCPSRFDGSYAAGAAIQSRLVNWRSRPWAVFRARHEDPL